MMYYKCYKIFINCFIQIFIYKTKIKFSRERDVATALKLVGGTRVRGCPVDDVGASVNIWVIRDHDKYKGLTAKEIGKKYQGFYTDTRTQNNRRKPVDKANPHKPVYLKNATKAGEKDEVVNRNEAIAKKTMDEDETF